MTTTREGNSRQVPQTLAFFHLLILMDSYLKVFRKFLASVSQITTTTVLIFSVTHWLSPQDQTAKLTRSAVCSCVLNASFISWKIKTNDQVRLVRPNLKAVKNNELEFLVENFVKKRSKGKLTIDSQIKILCLQFN